MQLISECSEGEASEGEAGGGGEPRPSCRPRRWKEG